MNRHHANHHGNTLGVALFCALIASGCDDGESSELPWESARTEVLQGQRAALSVAAPRGDACLDYGPGDECIRPQEECGEGVSSDVIVDEEGRLLDVICYPRGHELSVEEVEAQHGDIRQNQNKTVIHLDEVDDGVDLEGNLSIDANKVVVYGHGPEVSVISGDVLVDGNNIIVHGVRIQGDVEIVANNAYFVHCVIEGSVTISGNNTAISSCDVLGSVTITGNNAELTANHFADAPAISGKNTRCAENYGADDRNGDGVFDAEELAEPLRCGR